MAEQKQHRDPTDEDTDLRETGDLEGSPGRVPIGLTGGANS